MKLYRFTDWVHEPWIVEFDVLKETKCGYWIMDTCKWPSKERWISKDGHYAQTTKKLALESYIERKKHHLAHLKSKIKNVEKYIIYASNMDLDKKMTFYQLGF